MSINVQRLGRQIEGRRGLLLLCGLGAATAAAIAVAAELPGLRMAGHRLVPAQHQPLNPVTARTAAAGVNFSGALSHSKVLQNGNGEVFLKLTVSTPPATQAAAILPTDTVVVLDYSPSMAVDNRLPFAKRAIHELIDRLGANDRIALVIFDSSARVLSPLVSASPAEKSRLHELVESIDLGNGTNIGAGIELARSLLRAKDGERPQKVLLLSDGETNTGIIDPLKLGEMTAAINKESAIVSTIGMGLGFNEQLMASLADWGGGTFSYLERLDNLSEILNRNLQDARQLFASNSTIEIELPAGARVLDAGGYPVEERAGRTRIITGQLLSGSEKLVTVALQLPTTQLGSIEARRLAFAYGNGDSEQHLVLPAEATRVTVVEPARRQEVAASVDQAVYKEAWSKNNVGILKRKLRDYVSRGDTAAAKGALTEYQQKLSAAEAVAAAPIADERLKQELLAVNEEIDRANQGSSIEQAEKRNRLGKKLMSDGLAAQRK